MSAADGRIIKVPHEDRGFQDYEMRVDKFPILDPQGPDANFTLGSIARKAYLTSGIHGG
jgi:hypothetical protein